MTRTLFLLCGFPLLCALFFAIGGEDILGAIAAPALSLALCIAGWVILWLRLGFLKIRSNYAVLGILPFILLTCTPFIQGAFSAEALTCTMLISWLAATVVAYCCIMPDTVKEGQRRMDYISIGLGTCLAYMAIMQIIGSFWRLYPNAS